jgi:hypothetical protein
LASKSIMTLNRTIEGSRHHRHQQQVGTFEE